jgi:ABC-type phosphate transport system auxiliary subunit
MKIRKELNEMIYQEIVEANDKRNQRLKEYKELSERLESLKKEINERGVFIRDAQKICGIVLVQEKTLYYDNRNDAIQVPRLHTERGDYFPEYEIIEIESEEVPD